MRVRVRSSKSEVRCASACIAIIEVRVCVRRTVKFLATQHLELILFFFCLWSLGSRDLFWSFAKVSWFWFLKIISWAKQIQKFLFLKFNEYKSKKTANLCLKARFSVQNRLNHMKPFLCQCISIFFILIGIHNFGCRAAKLR